MKRHAFSLVELSIVLVILGLLVGGILAGQSLVRAAELRSVATEYDRHRTATMAFRDKYFALPGDFSRAEELWGTAAVADADCRDTPTTDTATCNGNADGSISISGARSREAFAFWKHLANAGLIEGTYTGTTSDPTYVWGATIGLNGPVGRTKGSGWGILSQADIAPYGGWYLNIFFPTRSQNILQFGKSATNGMLNTPVLKPDEAWNIDSKLDDGKPGTGRITSYNSDHTTESPSCTSSTTASSAAYVLTSTGVNCVLFFAL